METNFYDWSKILVFLANNADARSSLVCREMGIGSQSYVSTIIGLLKDKKLLKIQVEGRKNKYILTKKGAEIAEHLTRIFSLLKND